MTIAMLPRRFAPSFLAWAAAAGVFMALTFSYAALGAGAALLMGAWHATIALAVWFIAARSAGRVPWPESLTPRFVLRHVGAALTVAVVWALLDPSTLVILSDRLLEGSLERWPPIDAIEDVFDPYEDRFSDEPAFLLFRVLAGAAIYLGFAGAHYLMIAQGAAAQAELRALRAQLNPHFLFNTLHTIGSMMRKDASTAEAALESLGDMLRYVLKERDSEYVSFADEWMFVCRYLELQANRYDGVRVESQIAPEAMTALIPPMTLQPIIENSFRHGGFVAGGDACITINAEVQKGRLHVSVVDTGVGAHGPPAEGSAGVGLVTLRRRLARLYGPDARLDAGPAPGGGFRVSMDIPAAPRDA
jgi:hypothetical protein